MEKLLKSRNLLNLDKSLKWSIFASVLYGFCSGSMNFLNKAVLSVWQFHHPSVIILCQIISLSIGLHVLKISGKLTLVDYTFERARNLWKLSLIYCLNAVIALSALTDMNIPMYNAMRRCVPIGSLVLGCCVFKKQRPNRGIVFSVVLITVGTFLAAAGDLEFNLKGYAYGMFSVALQSIYLVQLQKAEIDLNIGALGIVYINSVNSLLPLIALVLFTGDITSIIQYDYWSDARFNFSYWILVFYGCLFTYSMFLCTTVNSALTTALVGVFKSAITTIVGMYTFGGVKATTMLVFGQVVNLSGGVLYTYEKYKIAVNKSNNKTQLLTSDLKSESDLVRLNDVKIVCENEENRESNTYSNLKD